MKAIQLFGISAVVVAMSASSAFAKVTDGSNARASAAAVTPLPRASTVADNVVVAPGQSAPAAAPQPAPAQVNVQPAQPVEAVPAYAPTHKTVVTEDRPHNYMATIALSALMGGVAGALIGGAIYYLDNQDHPTNIAYWAAGGVLVGTGVGLINVIADENRAERAVSTRFEKDPVPTYRLSLLKTTF
jgi:hypothetical protein